MKTKSTVEIKAIVKDKYNKIAEQGDGCCGDISCIKESYDTVEGHFEDADLDLGCGLPTEYAGIEKGHTVVDLGSGAGNDVFIARRETGDTGRVIGIDMAESMHEKAQANLAKLGYDNVEFRLGEIEDIPLRDNVADVVVSNCVFNLVPSKENAFAETFRILKPGGHFSIADVVIRGDMPEGLQEQAELYVGCVSGAMDADQYLEVIRNAGFVDINVAKERPIELTDELLDTYLDEKGKEAIRNAEIGIFSVTVNATKPQSGSCC